MLLLSCGFRAAVAQESLTQESLTQASLTQEYRGDRTIALDGRSTYSLEGRLEILGNRKTWLFFGFPLRLTWSQKSQNSVVVMPAL